MRLILAAVLAVAFATSASAGWKGKVNTDGPPSNPPGCTGGCVGGKF